MFSCLFLFAFVLTDWYSDTGCPAQISPVCHNPTWLPASWKVQAILRQVRALLVLFHFYRKKFSNLYVLLSSAWSLGQLSNHHLISPYCIMADKLPFWILAPIPQFIPYNLSPHAWDLDSTPWIPDFIGRIFLNFGIRAPLHWTTPCYCFCFHYEIFISCSINRSNQSKSSSYFDLLALRNANLSQENKFIKIIKFIKLHR